ncbi:MAG: HPP family protein [Kofleriaceae bacterium]
MKPYDLKVSDLMSTAVVTTRATDPVTGAHAEMQVGLIRHLPVVDERGRLVGILSDRDVLRCIAGHKPHRVGDIMTRDVVAVRPDTPAHTAAGIMINQAISSVLVTEDDGTLVGVVTVTDFVGLAQRALLQLPLER